MWTNPSKKSRQGSDPPHPGNAWILGTNGPAVHPLGMVSRRNSYNSQGSLPIKDVTKWGGVTSNPKQIVEIFVFSEKSAKYLQHCFPKYGCPQFDKDHTFYNLFLF